MPPKADIRPEDAHDQRSTTSAAGRRSPACPIAPITRASPISRPMPAATGGRSGGRTAVLRSSRVLLVRLLRWGCYSAWLCSHKVDEPVLLRLTTPVACGCRSRCGRYAMWLRSPKILEFVRLLLTTPVAWLPFEMWPSCNVASFSQNRRDQS